MAYFQVHPLCASMRKLEPLVEGGVAGAVVRLGFPDFGSEADHAEYVLEYREAVLA